MKTFRLPDLGEGLQDAEIVTWHVTPGDHVAADQPLVSVETEKAVVEIPSPQSGRIDRLYGEPGDIVAVGAPLVEFDEAGLSDTKAIVGELPKERATPAAPRKKPVVKAMPAARRLAAELGVDLQEITGSGAGGVITAEDVRRAAATPNRVKGAPLRGPRRAMAQAMIRAGAEIVAATVTGSADVSTWFGQDDPITRLIGAMVAGCAAVPALNSWFDGKGLTIRRHADVDLGIAMDTAEGLFVPVIRGANALGRDDLRKQLDRLKQQVANRTIQPQDLTGATITLSDFGTLVGDHATLIVMPPQVAILGAGRISERVVPINGAPTIRNILPLSLSIDHRALTGGEAARFLKAVIGALEEAKGVKP